MDASHDEGLRVIVRRSCALAAFAACAGWQTFADFLVQHAAHTTDCRRLQGALCLDGKPPARLRAPWVIA